MTATENYRRITAEIERITLKAGRPKGSVCCIAVSKNYSAKELLSVYKGGCRDFGENRIQELLTKDAKVPDDLQWHMIGSLQRNKVKQVVGKVALIHAVDSVKLAQEISRQSEKQGITTKILLQVNTSGEESKHGFSPEQCFSLFSELMQCSHCLIKGLMTMAPFSDDEKVIRNTFHDLRLLRDHLEKEHALALPELSMGMSNDYATAIEEGATFVRIGSKIFDG